MCRWNMKLTKNILKTLNSNTYDDKMKYTLLSFSDDEWKSLVGNADLNSYCMLSQLREIYKKIKKYSNGDYIFNLDLTEKFTDDPLCLVNDFVPYATYKFIMSPEFPDMFDAAEIDDEDFISIIENMSVRAQNEFRLLGEEGARKYALRNKPRILAGKSDFFTLKDYEYKSDFEFSIYLNLCDDLDYAVAKGERCLFGFRKTTELTEHFISLSEEERGEYLYSLSKEELCRLKNGFGDEACIYIDDKLNEARYAAGTLPKISERYSELKTDFLKYVKGQDKAIEQLVNGLFNAEIHNTVPADNKPYASFFFFGPPGTGKTLTATRLAELLKYPCKVFNMAEYAYEKDEITLIGSDRTWRDAKEGELFTFKKSCGDKKCIIIFDEIEKSNVTVKHSLLSLIGSGKLDNLYTGKVESFENAILIFTSNVGKRLYDNPNMNANALTFAKIRQAFEEEKDHQGSPKLSPEFVSRIGSNNIVLFNSLSLEDMGKIVTDRIDLLSKRLFNNYKLKVRYSDIFPYLMIFKEIRADARVLGARSEKFVKDEIYELLNLLNTGITSLKIDVDLKDTDKEIREIFEKIDKDKILYIGDNELDIETDRVKDEKELVEVMKNSYDLILADPFFGGTDNRSLSITDYNSKGIKLFYKLKEIDEETPVYIILNNEKDISMADRDSLMLDGARGFVCYDKLDELKDILDKLYLNKKAKELRQKGFILDFKTKQEIKGTKARVIIYDCKKYKSLDLDAEDIMVKNIPETSFNDVIGCGGAKNELSYFVKYLKNPVEFMQKGFKIPRGVLLYGPPGTGKTMLARAVAGESQVNFIALTSTELLLSTIEASKNKINQIFDLARRYSPAVIFIDEIDAIGKERNGSNYDSVLNLLLTQMDGFNTNTKHPIFVLAATNYSLNKLDSALLRRFDSKIYVDVPDRDDRSLYIKKFIERRNLNKISEAAINLFISRTVGLSLAETENILEFAIRYAYQKESEVDDEILTEAYDEYYSGSVKKRKSEEDYRRTAIHEAGHAVVSYIEGYTPDFITIVSRAEYGGYVLTDSEEKPVFSKNDILSRIRVTLSGRAAEETVYGKDEVNLGSGSDLKQASKLALTVVSALNDDKLFIPDEISEEEKMILNSRANDLLKKEYAKALSLIERNRDKIEALADILMAKNHLNREEFLNSVSLDRLKAEE